MTAADRRHIAAAIAAAEDGTSGRIAVRVVPGRDVEAFDRAKREFAAIGLRRHAAANAALVLVAPQSKKYAVLGDRALHERVGEGFWKGVVDEMQPMLAAGRQTDAILAAVDRIGEKLRAHFPESSAS